MYRNNFSGEANGAMQGLTNLASGTWTINYGVLQETTPTDSHVCLLKSINQLADFDMQYTFKSNNSIGNAGLIFRSDATYANCYIIVTDGTNLLFYKRVSAGFTLLTTTPMVHSFAKGEAVNVRVQAVGTTISVKYWVSTSTEPAAFQYTLTDSTFTSAGYFGFFQKLSGQAVITDIAYVKDTTALDAVAATDSNLYFSPYTWRTVGNNRLQTASPGAYFKANFTGTSFTAVFDTFTIGATNGASSNWPRLVYRVDGGAWTSQQITAAIVTLATGLSAGSHTIECALKMNIIGNDRWNTPGNAIRLLAVAVDIGSIISTPTIYPKRTIFYGDSEIEGYKAEGNNGGTDGNASKSCAYLLGSELKSEFGILGWASQGWTVAGQGNIPAFSASWDNYSLGFGRLVNGLLSPQPDYIFINQGINDSAVADATLQAEVTARLTAIRAAAPNAKIFVIIPFTQTKASAIASGITGFIDSNTYKIDLGTDGNTFSVTTANTLYSFDALHPNANGHYNLNRLLVAAVQSVLGGTRLLATNRTAR